MKKLNLSLPDPLYEHLAKEAERLGLRLTELVRTRLLYGGTSPLKPIAESDPSPEQGHSHPQVKPPPARRNREAA